MLEEKLHNVIIHHLSIVLEYNAFERFDGVSDKKAFTELIGKDPAFAPFFLDNPKYITARIGGNLITSLHRKLGDMYEEIFQILLEENLHIPSNELSLSLELNVDGQLQIRSTDGFVRYAHLSPSDSARIKTIQTADSIGMAFEVRSCYQIGDSKRIQADRDMALALRKKNIEPVMIVFCASSLTSPIRRLREYWQIYEGKESFNFIKTLTDFDLYSYLQDENATIRKLMNKIFDMM